MQILKTISFCLTFLLISGCVPTQFEQRIKRLESSLNDIRSFQSEQMAQVAELQREMRALTGKTEELEYSANKRYGTDLDALRQDLSSLKRRVPPPANVPSQPLEEDEAAADRANLVGFRDALAKIRTANYTDALTDLQMIKSSVPTDALPHVVFWIGITYDGLSEYKNALATYNDFIQGYPKHRRAPLTLLRQASVFEKLGDATASQFTLQKLVKDYPNSPEALAVKSKITTPAQQPAAPSKASKPAAPKKK